MLLSSQSRGFSPHHFFLEKNGAGFTLIELLVSTAIIVFIITVGLFDYRTYGENAAMDKLANEVVLALREAQIYSTGVKEIEPGTGIFFGKYAIHFHSNEYIFRVYNGDTQVDVATYPVKGSIEQLFYQVVVSAPEVIYDSTIFFEKSKLAPIIRKTVGSVDGYKLELVLSSPSGLVSRRVCVEQTGRIFISRLECP